MALTAYKHYRIWMTKNSAQPATSGYFTINEIGLYEETETGVNLAIGATVAAHSNYDAASVAANAIDGNKNTFWESNNVLEPKWITISLPAPKVVRTLYLSSTRYSNEVPVDWVFQGSNDLAEWTNLYNVKDWTATTIPKSDYERMNLVVSGISKLENGPPSTRVLVYCWDTGALLESVKPMANGEWQYRSRDGSNVLITHIGPSGFQPISDGPVTPQAV